MILTKEIKFIDNIYKLSRDYNSKVAENRRHSREVFFTILQPFLWNYHFIFYVKFHYSAC